MEYLQAGRLSAGSSFGATRTRASTASIAGAGWPEGGQGKKRRASATCRSGNEDLQHGDRRVEARELLERTRLDAGQLAWPEQDSGGWEGGAP